MKTNKKFARIFLVRHGEVKNPKNIIYGYLPLPLSPKGKVQARKAGWVLKKQNIGAIFTSPMKRAQETSQIIKKALGNKIKIITDKNLRESGLGHLREGLTKEEAARKYPQAHLFYTRTPAKVKTGESFTHQAERMLKAINNGIRNHSGQNLVFISHRDPILAALLKIAKRSFNDLHKVKAICDKGSVCEIWSAGKRLINKTYLAS